MAEIDERASNSSATAADASAFSAVSGGDMGEKVRQKDWSQTPFGPLASWPQSLKTAVALMLESSFAMVVAWGPEFRFLYNDRYRPVLGNKHPFALGAPAKDIFPEVWDHLIGPLFQRTRRGETVAVDDLYIPLHRYGYLENCYFTISYSPIRDETGGVGGMLAVVAETTERVEGERRLTTLRDLARRATEAKTPDDACAHAAAILRENLVDVPFALLYLLEDGGTRARLVANTGVPTGHTAAPEQIPLADSSDSAWPLRDVLGSGRPLVVDNVVRRFDALPSGPYPEPVHTALLLPLTRPGLAQPYGVLIAGVSARRALNERYRDFLELAAEHVTTAIANARAFEEERRRADALAEIDRAKTAFFSNVSHEFRTPLTLMLGPIEELLARSENLPPEARAQLDLTHRNSLRLLKLVNTLLDFSRIEAGRIQASFEATDLAALTTELASVFRSAVERAGLKLLVDCRLDEPVYVDREMWEKIVFNLLSNALKFTFAGEIETTLRRTGRQIELVVRDTGTGIPTDELTRIFERFHRVKGAQGRSYEGSGIGLSLVQELVKLHGGRIRVESELGRGSRFIVSLPLGKEHLPAEHIGATRRSTSTAVRADAYIDEALRWLPDSSTQSAFSSESREPAATTDGALRLDQDQAAPRILLADDNADMRDYVRRLLVQSGCEVDAVADGAVALQRARTRPPDLVLSDVMMPVLDGFGLLRELRADPAFTFVPIILLSARAGEDSRIEGVQAGADDYLIKPFSARELLARVESHVKVARLRRKARRALDQRTAQFETLLNQAPIGVYTVDADFKIRDINPTARAALGGDSDLIGRDLEEVVHQLWKQEQADDIVRRFRHTLATGESHEVPEWIDRRRDRNVTEYYEWKIDRIPLPDDRFGVVCYFRDISAQVKARDTALAANRAKDEFLATLSHELRTPLNPVLLIASDAAHNDALPEAIRNDFKLIADHVSLQAKLIDDLLDLNRLVRGKLNLERRPLDLHAVVRDAATTVPDSIVEKGIELRFDLLTRRPVVDGDPVRLRQVFWNLLNNALKFTPPGGTITLRSAECGDTGEFEISVCDSGSGISPADIERVFDPFVQGEVAARSGLGLGLAIARMLVERHGGSIFAESAGSGRGATVVVRLPRAGGTGGAGELADGSGEQPAATARVARPGRVLFVEDHTPTRGALTTLLQRRGYNVIAVASVAEALERSREAKIDLLISDLGLPDGDGCQIMSSLRHRNPGLRGIAISGYGMAADLDRSRAAGFGEHLTKPVSFTSLERALARLFGLARSES